MICILFVGIYIILRCERNIISDMKEELLRKLIDGSYLCACNHGFHEEDLSIRHSLMLIVTEISGAVEADRMCRHANIESYEDEIRYGADVYDKDTRSPFEKYIKDTVEDELADVCIRIFDLCGMLGIVPRVFVDDDIRETFDELFGKMSFCERMFELSYQFTRYDADSDLDDFSFMRDNLGVALSFLMCMCESMGIDIMNHIELKMRYNEMRPYKNGKKY